MPRQRIHFLHSHTRVRFSAKHTAGDSQWTLAVGAVLMGGFGMGIWGMAPAYATERFPTSVRGVGAGFCYHAAAAIGAVMPTVLGWLEDGGMAFAEAMKLAMLASGVCALILIWMGPETRGREFTATDSGDA